MSLNLLMHLWKPFWLYILCFLFQSYRQEQEKRKEPWLCQLLFLSEVQGPRILKASTPEGMIKISPKNHIPTYGAASQSVELATATPPWPILLYLQQPVWRGLLNHTLITKHPMKKRKQMRAISQVLSCAITAKTDSMTAISRVS